MTRDELADYAFRVASDHPPSPYDGEGWLSYVLGEGKASTFYQALALLSAFTAADENGKVKLDDILSFAPEPGSAMFISLRDLTFAVMDAKDTQAINWVREQFGEVAANEIDDHLGQHLPEWIKNSGDPERD